MCQIAFGFSASEQRAVHLDQNLSVELESVFRQEPSLRSCIACGHCAAVCSAGYFTGLQFYRLNILAQRGLLPELAKKAQACMLCGKCQMTCPRGVNIRHGMLLLSQL